MSVNNLGAKHLTAAQKAAIDAGLNSIITALTTVSPNLTTDDRLKYGSINEQNKLLVNKSNDYHINQSALQSPDVDWADFDADFTERSFADTRLNTIDSVKKMLEDYKIVHDYDNYQSALVDYEYTKYKAGTNTPGFAAKAAELGQFFAQSSTTQTPTN